MNTLVDRINEGMTTEGDGYLVSRILHRMAAYEMALRRIARHGTGDAAMLAARVLGDPDRAYDPAVFDPAAEACDACRNA